MVSLVKYVNELTTRFPNLGDRAERAKTLVEQGNVRVLQTGTATREVRFRVDGMTCSIQGGYCDCQDREAPLFNGSRLCVHRIAAMMEWKRRQRPQRSVPIDGAGQPQAVAPETQRLIDILTQANRVGCRDVRLYVRVAMTFDRRQVDATLNHLEGYILYGDGRRRVRLDEQGEEFAFTIPQLKQALSAVGWRYERKNKTRAGNIAWLSETWYFRPQTNREKALPPFEGTNVGPVGFSEIKGKGLKLEW